jgi:uncharacterized membrane protein YsdA (DUF1294 family)
LIKRLEAWEGGGSLRVTRVTLAIAYLIVVALMSLVCFIAYGMDKRRAGSGGRRVSERALHVMAFLGGWPGALIAQRQFRHKTQKVSFRIVFWLVVVVHVGIVGAVAYRIVTAPEATASDRLPPEGSEKRIRLRSGS